MPQIDRSKDRKGLVRFTIGNKLPRGVNWERFQSAHDDLTDYNTKHKTLHTKKHDEDGMLLLSLNRGLRVLALVLTFKLGMFPCLSRHSAAQLYDPHPCSHHHVNGTFCEPSSPCLVLRALQNNFLLLLVNHHQHQSYLPHAAKLIS